MDRFRSYAYQVSKNSTRTCWVLKCDIRKFFASIDHPVLMEILTSRVSNKKVVSLLGNIVESFSSTAQGKGLPLGNLTSQLLVNVYMNEFDQFVKHKLKEKSYVRYADDFVLLSHDRKHLESLVLQIDVFLRKRLNLELHPHKVSIGTFAAGVDFLGWVHFPDHRVLRSVARRRMQNALGKGISIASTCSYKGLLSHGNAKGLTSLVEAARQCER